MKFITQPIINYVKYRILHLDDTPHKIALGVALGFIIAYTPLLGFHMLLATFFCWLFNANKAAGIATVWLSNPFTFVLIYYPCYLIGHQVLLFRKNGTLSSEQIAQMFERLMSFEYVWTNIITFKFWKDLAALLMNVGIEMAVGGALIGGTLGLLSYWLIRHLVVWYRRVHMPALKKKTLNPKDIPET